MPSYPAHPLIALATLALILISAGRSIRHFARRGDGDVGPFLFGRVLRAWYVAQLEPVTQRLVARRVSPSVLTYAQLGIAVAVAALYANGWIFSAGWLLLLCGTCDILDGQLARRLDQVSRRGAFLDSVVDRYVDGIIFMGLAYLCRDLSWLFWTVLLALLGTQMISYTRARAEGLGLDCKIGWMQRPERYVLLGLGSLFGSLFAHLVAPLALAPRFLLFHGAIAVLAILVNITAVQRIVWTQRQLEHDK